jgi:hypothetical protein
MSGMAAEIANRMAEEGGAVPGIEGEVGPPSAGTSNTDPAPTGGTTPETIPYSRFKEVNDRLSELKGFETLAGYGYDSDSLGRLAAFEATYQADPNGTWKAMADNLDLPQELRDALEAHLGEGAAPGTAETQPSAEASPSTDLPPEVVERLAYVDQLKAEREQEQNNAQLDRVLAVWDELDKQDRVETPRMIKLMAIQATAGSSSGLNTVDDLAKAARTSINEFRGAVLGSAVQGTGIRGSSPALPGSAPAATPPVSFGGDIKAASKAALEAINRGELPGLTGG